MYIFLFYCIVILIFPLSLLSQVSVQSLTNLNSIISLDTQNESQSSNWYLLDGNLSEIELKQIDGANFESYKWRQAVVPGNLIKNASDLANKKNVLLAKWIQFPSEKYSNLTFRLGIINDKDKTYLNGHLIGEMGDWSSEDPAAYDKIRIYPIPNNIVKFGDKNLLLIHIKPYFDYTVGIEQDETSIGPTELIFSKFYKEEFLKLIFQTVYLTFGTYFLFLFVRRRRDRENLFFALFSFSLVLYNLLRNQIKYELNVSFVLLKEIEYITLITLIPFMYHFLRTLFNFRYTTIGKFIDSVQIIFILLILFYQNIEFNNYLMSKFIQPSWIVYLGLIVYILFKSWKNSDRRAIYISGGIGIVLIAVIIDILSTRGYFVFPRMLGYTFLAFNVSLSIILANSFVRLNEEVEDLNKNLEIKVEQRTDALNESLNQLKILKEKQDGDYFLTSLLIQPLAKNENQIHNVLVQSYVDQKKKFQFRGKEGEIGGDICIVGSIQLTSGNYTVFANGDAMGKSIQGAGGALVLGVVFQSILSRTKSSYTKNRPPELWLKDLYIELQSVFVSFDGSMLSSVVIGMISEKTGFMFYLNLEHPWNVLYRDGVASFLETELSMRKLGFPKNDESFQIKTFKFQKDDVLIVGSDGRDDIALGESEEGRIINEDENLILNLVQKTEADLPILVEEIKKQGEVTDDLSFLRIEYSPNQEEIQLDVETKEQIAKAKNQLTKKNYDSAIKILNSSLQTITHPKLWSLLGKVHFKSKNWSDAKLHLENAIPFYPEKEELLYLYAVCLFKLGQWNEGIVQAERLFLRNKFHKKNQELLFYLLRKTENHEKSEYYSKFLKAV